jgi:hypothetical protein
MTRRPHWVGEVLVALCLLVVYDFVAGLVRVQADLAYAHGRALLNLSPGRIEYVADHWLADIPWLQAPASYYYDLAHINITMAVFVGCWVFRGAVYRRARTALVAINVLGLVAFALYPAAPPRLLPAAGFVDIVARSGTWGSWEGDATAVEHTNVFGSMPSLHIAWAVWVALTVWSMTPRRTWRVLAWLHVVVTAVVVVVTGNHYLIDLLAGAATAAFAWTVAGYVPTVDWRSAGVFRRTQPVPVVEPEAHRDLTATLQGS